jgi:hypothetical protein
MEMGVLADHNSSMSGTLKSVDSTAIISQAGILTIAMFIFLKETYSIAMLEQKANRLRKETGSTKLRSAMSLDLTPKELFKKSIFRPVKMLFLSPIVLLLSLYMAFVYGILYLLFTTISSVFIGTYGLSQGLSGLAFWVWVSA